MSPATTLPGFLGDKSVNRALVILGLVILVAGLAWSWVRRLPLFHLPGDVVIDRPGLKIFVPITTMLLLSLAISGVAWLLRR